MGGAWPWMFPSAVEFRDLFAVEGQLITGPAAFIPARYKTGTENEIYPRNSVSPPSCGRLVNMTLLRVLLMSSAVIVSVQSFPSTTKYLENNSTKSQATETTNPSTQFTQQPEAMLEIQTEPEDKSPTIEFVFKGPIESLTIQKGTNREKYTVLSSKKGEAEKLKFSVPGTENITKTAQLNELNNTNTSNNENFPSEISIKRDKWLFNPQEESSIQGGLPKYFYDTAKSIHPFPELYDESMRNGATHLKKENSVNFHVPLTEEKINQPPQTAGPALFPRSIYVREFDLPFYD
ncbi:GOLD domain-containing protein [Trichonephila clavata]|uniref:GOLD domain-containing protein n=1 Tax=Trichonephila clavata TaxID=2740835 RepID=A0A8X6LKZ3_TRICU|nr:GOLD domain-containing protein [Trichonephila clavata]